MACRAGRSVSLFANANWCPRMDDWLDLRPICTGGFPKPSYQKGFVPGKYRQLPDVSWLADPFTGAVILISIPGQVPEQVYQVVGGTSLATPMFSALWAIANQEALAGGGTEPLNTQRPRC
jgi:subtilase family serine protease